MKIGKFEMDVIYDITCNKCGKSRINIGYIKPLFTKPTSKDLKEEGWSFEEEVGNVCPNYNRGYCY